MSIWKQVTQWQVKLLPNTWIQIRTATKRAAGSRTSMKDSAGRRLGPKKYEGQKVKPGEIIIRQRGTKFFPGENAGIGKDHTIFALEPGYVRYYLDPFHPKRKFIGVSLKAELKLPTPHFEPRLRRFGGSVIEDPIIAAKEELSLPRKRFLVKDEILSNLKSREENRQKLIDEFKKILTHDLALTFEGTELDLATKYLLRLRTCLKNGFKLTDAQFNSKYYLETELLLNFKQQENVSNKLSDSLATLSKVTSKLDQTISFDNKLKLIQFISEEDKLAWKSNFIEELKMLPINTKGDKELILSKFDESSKYLTLSEEVRLRRRFLKPVKPESTAIGRKSDKDVVIVKRYNYETGKVEEIIRTKDAFLSRL